MFNRLRGFCFKGYQCGNLGKSHQNGDYLNQAMQKSCPPTRFETTTVRLLAHGTSAIERLLDYRFSV